MAWEHAAPEQQKGLLGTFLTCIEPRRSPNNWAVRLRIEHDSTPAMHVKQRMPLRLRCSGRNIRAGASYAWKCLCCD
jgi:hypothetical protein